MIAGDELEEVASPDGGHTYSLAGKRFDSVTATLEERGFIDTRFFTDGSAIRGRLVHAAIKLVDQGGVNQDSLTEEYLGVDIRGYVAAYELFKKETRFEPKLLEQKVYDPSWMYAGRLDKTGRFPGMKLPAILEAKSGGIEDWAALQVAAYEACLDDRHNRFGLQLSEDGKYHLEPYKDPNDILVFRSALMCSRWFQAH